MSVFGALFRQLAWSITQLFAWVRLTVYWMFNWGLKKPIKPVVTEVRLDWEKVSRDDAAFRQWQQWAVNESSDSIALQLVEWTAVGSTEPDWWEKGPQALPTQDDFVLEQWMQAGLPQAGPWVLRMSDGATVHSTTALTVEEAVCWQWARQQDSKALRWCNFSEAQKSTTADALIRKHLSSFKTNFKAMKELERLVSSYLEQGVLPEAQSVLENWATRWKKSLAILE